MYIICISMYIICIFNRKYIIYTMCTYFENQITKRHWTILFPNINRLLVAPSFVIYPLIIDILILANTQFLIECISIVYLFKHLIANIFIQSPMKSAFIIASNQVLWKVLLKKYLWWKAVYVWILKRKYFWITICVKPSF